MKNLLVMGLISACFVVSGAKINTLPPPAGWETIDVKTVKRTFSSLSGTTVWIPGKRASYINLPRLNISPDGMYLQFELSSSVAGRGGLNMQFGPKDKMDRHYRSFEVVGDGKFHRYVLPLADRTPGNITRLRLLPLDQHGAQIVLRNLQIISLKFPPASAWDTTELRQIKRGVDSISGVTRWVPGKLAPYINIRQLKINPKNQHLVFELASSVSGTGFLNFQFGPKDNIHRHYKSFTVPGKGEFRTYSFPIYDGVSTDLSRIRLMPVDQDGAKIEIRHVRLVPSSELTMENNRRVGELYLWSGEGICQRQDVAGVLSATSIFSKSGTCPQLFSPALKLPANNRMLVFEIASDMGGEGLMSYHFEQDRIPLTRHAYFKLSGDREFHPVFLPFEGASNSPLAAIRLIPIRRDGAKFQIRNLRVVDPAEKLKIMEECRQELLKDSQLSFLGFNAVTYLPVSGRSPSGKTVIFRSSADRPYLSPRGLFNFPPADGRHALYLDYKSVQSGSLALQINFFNPFGQPAGQVKKAIDLAAAQSGRVVTDFTVPEQVSEFELKLTPQKIPGSGVALVAARVEPVPAPEDSMQPLKSKFIWLPQPQWQSWLCYFRKEFQLKKVPVAAVLQITADNEVREIYVNGVRLAAGGNRTNRTSTDIYEISPYLKPGKNLIAVLAADYGGGRGMMCDLALSTMGEPFRVIRSDETFRCATYSMKSPDWMKLNFDDSAWLYAQNQNIGMHPREMGYRQPLSYPILKNCRTQAHVTDQYINYSFECIPPSSQLTLEPRLTGPNAHTFPTVTFKNLRSGERNTLKGRIPIPEILDGGNYVFEINLPHGAARVAERSCALRLPASPRTELPTVKVVYGNNRVPLLSLNGGKPEISMLHAWEHECKITDLIVKNSHHAGVHQYWIGGHALLQPDGSYDNSSFDRICRTVLQRDPQAKIVLQIMVGSSMWENFSLKPLLKLYPEELVCDETGETLLPLYAESGLKMRALSWASEVWRAEARRIVTSVIRYVKNKPYAKNIIGFNPLAGLGFEWKYYGGHSRLYVDYSKPARKKFARFVLNKHGSLAQVAKLYSEKITTEDAIRPPSPAERNLHERGWDFINPATRQRLIDYREFLSFLVADTIDDLGKVIKKETNGRSLVGCYYGYVFSAMGFAWNESGHLALERILKSPNVDYLVTLVTYDNRKPGQESGSSHPVAAFKVHNKASVLQTDFRTHHAGNVSYTTSANIRESCEVLKRELAWNLVEGAAFEYGYFGTGWIARDHRQMAVIGKGEQLNYRLAQADTVDRNFKNRVAFIFDEQSINHTVQDTHLVRMFGRDLQYAMAHTGAGVDFFLAENLEQIPEDYKFYLFANLSTVTPAQRQVIDRKFKKSGNTLLFLHAPGISDGERLSPTRVGDLLQLKMQISTQPNPGIARTTAHPIVSANFAPNSVIGERRNRPVPVLLPQEGEVLARFTHNAQPAWIVKKFPTWQLFYSMIPPSSPMLQAMFRAAGVHIYNANLLDSTKGNGRLFAVHTLDGGERTFYLPPGCRQVEELFSGRILPVRNNRFSYQVEPGSTYLFWGK